MTQDLEQLARRTVKLTAVCAKIKRQNHVKVLNDIRTEILAEGVFGDYEKHVIAETDRKIAELVSEPVWQWH